MERWERRSVVPAKVLCVFCHRLLFIGTYFCPSLVGLQILVAYPRVIIMGSDLALLATMEKRSGMNVKSFGIIGKDTEVRALTREATLRAQGLVHRTRRVFQLLAGLLARSSCLRSPCSVLWIPASKRRGGIVEGVIMGVEIWVA
jgi:hypothetical protein